VDRQRRLDGECSCGSDLLLARMTAVVIAQRAVAAHEAGAVYSLRQSLVDLAAAAEIAAERMTSR
jgi:hypothetical protein